MPHPPVPLSDLWGPLALSLLAGEMREVSLGTVASSICFSVIQLMPPVPGSRTCISLTVPALAASAAAGRKPVGYCPQPPLALPARGEGTVGMDGGGGKHTAAETSLLGRLQPGRGPEPLRAVPVCPCSLQGGFSCPIPTRCVVPTAPTSGEYGAPSWHLEGGGDGAHQCSQGCSEDLGWLLPPASSEVTRSWGTVLLALVLLVSDSTVQYSCPATAMSSHWLDRPS